MPHQGFKKMVRGNMDVICDEAKMDDCAQFIDGFLEVMKEDLEAKRSLRNLWEFMTQQIITNTRGEPASMSRMRKDQQYYTPSEHPLWAILHSRGQ